ncbi:outer membrane protein assembly factor BamD [Falsiroseomonas oryzae]|uniref:outer membrane protein assembly factor BamD n=1 Tax=Falsiroseomonas oryzae TaxID=2766473 RepID=UPI0022EB2327|nr:outer membrane protein assembly factor BamD [Roseomonas sp. MO-31]
MRTAIPMFRRLPLLILLLLPIAGCSSWDGREASLQQRTRADMSAEGLYAAGLEALQREQYGAAVQLFDTVEREHPYSAFATNAKLMSAYSEYMRNRYTEALGALDRFIQLHPSHRDIAYAYYLRALSLYEQIHDTERDQRTTEQAMVALQEVANRFPNTPYARDARLKMDLARDHLAGREMVVGRFYQNRRLFGAAIGRFRRVVDEYQTTNHVPEALHRLTEIYLALGLTEEARRTASVLGHNYPGSAWYQDSYALLVDGAQPAPQDRPSWISRAVSTVTFGVF